MEFECFVTGAILQSILITYKNSYGCPVSLVMKVPTTFSRMRIRPTATACVQCGVCNKVCPMEVDVMAAIAADNSVRDTECIYCGACR